jgi:type IV pilus biogenesis protein CpaD/CtpE
LLILVGLSACAGAPQTPPIAMSRSCPPWVEYPVDRHSNAGSPYLGCTNANNLQTMLDAPGDIDHGRALGPANGERETIGVENYQQGKIKDFENANAPQPVFFAPGGSGQ